jgi:hypothetical protein
MVKPSAASKTKERTTLPSKKKDKDRRVRFTAEEGYHKQSERLTPEGKYPRLIGPASSRSPRSVLSRFVTRKEDDAHVLSPSL